MQRGRSAVCHPARETESKCNGLAGQVTAKEATGKLGRTASPASWKRACFALYLLKASFTCARYLERLTGEDSAPGRAIGVKTRQQSGAPNRTRLGMLALKQPLVRRKVLASLLVVPLRSLLLNVWRSGKRAASTRVRCKTARQ